MKKSPIASCRLVANFGIEGDAHAGCGDRQVSLLSKESVDAIRGRGVDARPGSFAENILTEGLDLSVLKPGDRFGLGADVMLSVSQIGKKCHDRCAIYEKTGDCIMPREGVFARVEAGGELNVGDEIKIFPV